MCLWTFSPGFHKLVPLTSLSIYLSIYRGSDCQSVKAGSSYGARLSGKSNKNSIKLEGTPLSCVDTRSNVPVTSLQVVVDRPEGGRDVPFSPVIHPTWRRISGKRSRGGKTGGRRHRGNEIRRKKPLGSSSRAPTVCSQKMGSATCNSGWRRQCLAARYT